MLDTIKYIHQDFLALLLNPVLHLYFSFSSLLKGELFPVIFSFTYSCGLAGGTVADGNATEWLIITAFITLISIKLITKKPKRLFLLIFLLYVVIFLIGLLSHILKGDTSSFCY